MTAPLPLIRKFDALTKRVEEELDEDDLYAFDPLDALPLFEKWIKIRADLMATEPELDDIAPCVPPKPEHDKEHWDYDGRGFIHRNDIVRIWKEMKSVREILNHPSRQVQQVSIDREGIFVAGQAFDAMLAVTSILRAATKAITIVDAYVSEDTLKLVSVKQDAVAANVLTGTKQNVAAFANAARAFNAQYAAGPPLEVRTTAAFHDRFIVIDDADYYHFGTSIKDAAKKNAFMFSKIEEPAMLAVIKSEIATQWAAATVVAL
jgi:hypothetical protein